MHAISRRLYELLHLCFAIYVTRRASFCNRSKTRSSHHHPLLSLSLSLSHPPPLSLSLSHHNPLLFLSLSLSHPLSLYLSYYLLFPPPFQISGGIILASLVQVLVGATGVIGYLMNFIGPLTIIPTVSLIGLSLYHGMIRAAAVHWGVACL
jgi:hypothetical protein